MSRKRRTDDNLLEFFGGRYHHKTLKQSPYVKRRLKGERHYGNVLYHANRLAWDHNSYHLDHISHGFDNTQRIGDKVLIEKVKLRGALALHTLVPHYSDPIPPSFPQHPYENEVRVLVILNRQGVRNTNGRTLLEELLEPPSFYDPDEPATHTRTWIDQPRNTKFLDRYQILHDENHLVTYSSAGYLAVPQQSSAPENDWSLSSYSCPRLEPLHINLKVNKIFNYSKDFDDPISGNRLHLMFLPRVISTTNGVNPPNPDVESVSFTFTQRVTFTDI